MARPDSDKDPEELAMKKEMAELICHTICKRGWNQSEAAIMLGTTQNKISDLERGNLHGVSISKLMSLLTYLDFNVHVIVEETSPRRLGTMAMRRLPTSPKR